MTNIYQKYFLSIVFGVSLLASLGSLYFSEILGWAPCVLCWYQRVFMYSIVIVSALAIIFKDAKAYRYIITLAVIGGLISLYHNLLYWGLIPESAGPCQNGVSCTAKYLELYGFITIPFLCLLAFILITVIMIIDKKNENK